MLSIEIITALKTCTDTWSSEEIELTEFVKHVCTGNDITYDHVDNLRVNARLLIEDLHKWTVAKSIEVIGPREVMIYLLDKYGVSFTLPMPKRKKSNNNILDTLCINLTDQARAGELDPVIGMTKEIDSCITILQRRTKSNPVLTGEAGVGKTSVVRGLALAIADGAVPKILLTKNIYSLDVGTMIENTGVRGALESKVREILAAAMRTRDILFIDEIHSIVGAGGQGGQDIANQFKPALASGKLSCIGATTLDEYRRYIESDPALERRFSIVQIDEPSVESATQTLVGLSELYEVHHSVVIPKETCSIMAKLASRYMVDRNLPDSAIDVMDISCLNAAKRTSSIGSTTITLREWRDIISSGRFGEAALKKPRYQYGRAEESIVTEEDVQMAVESLSRRTIYISIKDQLKDVEEKLLSVVIGQDDQIREICRLLKSGYLYSSGKTMGGLLLVGRPGTGKTYTGTMIAEAMFDGNILTLGMANYTEAHSASNLIGPPKGYVGYDEGGELTEYVHAHPSCVVMLDNIECAHPNVYDIINGILSSGKLTGSNGRTVDFSGVLILLTSNSGVDVMAPDRKVIGFGGTPTSESSRKKELDKSIGSILPEHVMDRIHSRIVYNNLTEDDIGRIFDLELGKCLSSSRGPRITVTDPAKRHLVSKNWKNGDGARIVQKIISRDVLDLVADRYVSGELGSSDTITVDLIGDSIAITGGELNDVINQKSEMPS